MEDNIFDLLTKAELISIIITCQDDNIKLYLHERAKDALSGRISRVEKKRRKQDRPLTDYRQRHIALQVVYDGGKYSGFSSQAENQGPTVESAIFDVMERINLITGRRNCGYSRCGRTDKGVSAYSQIIALRLRSNFPKSLDDSKIPLHPLDTAEVTQTKKLTLKGGAKCTKTSDVAVSEIDYCRVLNYKLPDDIRIVGTSEVTDGFSSRFSARSRTYRYFFHLKQLDGSVLNVNKMIQAAKLLEGRHDFRNFCKPNVVATSNYVRVIISTSISPFSDASRDISCPENENSVYVFQITGFAFLWHMVRCIMSVLLMIGKGDEDGDIISHLLDISQISGRPNYLIADEGGLVLQECSYNNLTIFHSPSVLASCEICWLHQRQKLQIAVSKLTNSIQSIRSNAKVRSIDVEKIISENSSSIDSSSFSGVGELITWSRASEILNANLGSKWPSIVSHTKKDVPHKPLITRQRGFSIEERSSSLSAFNKRKMDDNRDWSDDVKIKQPRLNDEDFDEEIVDVDAFHEEMQSEGTLWNRK